MTCEVLLFARARELAGQGRLRVEVADGATVGDLRLALAVAEPRLVDLLRRSAVAVDQEFAGDEVVLESGSEIALLPPVSGG